MDPNSDFEHALKNYMTVIMGYADLLLEDCGPGDQRRLDLLEMLKAARAAVALVDAQREARR